MPEEPNNPINNTPPEHSPSVDDTLSAWGDAPIVEERSIAYDNSFSRDLPVEVPELTPVVSPVFGTSELVTSPVSTRVEPASEPVPSVFLEPDTIPGPIVPVVARRKKGVIIGIIISAAIFLLAGTGVFAYTFWYQNPEKVITDAIINAVTAKTAIYSGAITMKSTDIKASIDFNAKQADPAGSLDAKLTVNMGGKDFALDGSMLTNTSGDLYFKVSHLTDTVAAIKALIGTSTAAAIDKVVTKIDGTWIKISSQDLKAYSDSTASTKACIDTTVSKFKNDRSALNEISDLYKKHQFIVVDQNLGQKDGNLGYKLKSDATVGKAFIEGLKNTKIYTSLHECDRTFTIDTSDMVATNSSTPVEVWISMWTHQITKVSLDSKDNDTKYSLTITPEFNKPVTIETPSTSTSLSQMQSDLEAVFMGITNSFDAASSSASAANDASIISSAVLTYSSNHRAVYPTQIQIMPSLTPDLQAKLSLGMPSATNPTAIGYALCKNAKGIDLSYYDQTSKSIKHEISGTCS